MEILLLIIGAVLFAAGFVIPEKNKKSNQTNVKLEEKKIREMVEKEVDQAKLQITDTVDETINYAIEKTERSLDRLTNEKIMAVSEYSDTVLENINKNHKEVMFLYDMLNDKHKNLTETVSEVTKTAKEAEDTVKEVVQTVAEIKKETLELQPKTEEWQQETPVNLETSANKVSPSSVDADAKKGTGHPKRKTAKKEPKKMLAVQEENKKSDITISFTPDSTDGKNNNERIRALHKAGKSNMAIAKELGLGIGEVKLVIDLSEGM